MPVGVSMLELRNLRLDRADILCRRSSIHYEPIRTTPLASQQKYDFLSTPTRVSPINATKLTEVDFDQDREQGTGKPRCLS